MARHLLECFRERCAFIDGRRVAVRWYPISIDAADFENLAAAPQVRAYEEELILVEDFSTPVIPRLEEPKIAQKYRALIAGIRHVTGSDDPAHSANFISRDVSTISLAHSNFHDRCLSLKTGTARPSLRNTSVTCLKNS